MPKRSRRLYCSTCGKHVSSIAHWAKVHRAMLRRKRGKASRTRSGGSGRVRVPSALLKRLAAACSAFYGK